MKIKIVNTIQWVLMVFAIVVFSAVASCQDSVRLKIVYSKRIGDTVYYQFKILSTKEIVNSKCCCLTQHKKGEVIVRAKKDLEFIKPTF